MTNKYWLRPTFCNRIMKPPDTTNDYINKLINK